MDLEKDCLQMCLELKVTHPEARVLKVVNALNPWGERLGFSLFHQSGIYRYHFVLEIDSQIIDPFLKDPIQKDKYLQSVYENHEDLKMV